MILDRMSQMIRVGFVNARQPEKMRVKVTVRDTTNAPLITDWLPVLCPRASGDMQYDLPDLGDQVLCLFLPYGLEQGFVVGAMYGRQVPPVQSGDKWHRVFSDGTMLEYDRAAHKFSAKVQGDFQLDVTGKIDVKAGGPMTLEAPIIYERGTLVNTATDGSPGNAVISGGLQVLSGGVTVPDGDVVAGAVSLTNHLTQDVEPGSGQSGPPVGGGSASGPGSGESGDNSTETERHLGAVAEIVAQRGSDIDKLILCLPEVAYAEAEKQINPDNRQGWLYLHGMFEKWLSGPANPEALSNPRVFWVNQEWALSYTRANLAYEQLRSRSYLFSPAARDELANILRRDKKLVPDRRCDFDYITTSPSHWRADYFQQVTVRGMDAFPPDGLMAAMGNFQFRALAKGYTVPEDDHHLIYVTGVSVFIWDSFNFEDDVPLGFWRCSPPQFSSEPFDSSQELTNGLFRNFRDSFGFGEDFLVLSHPLPLDPFTAFVYETDS